MARLYTFPSTAFEPERAAIERAFEVLYVGKRPSTVRSDRVAVRHWFDWFGYRVPRETDVLRYIDHARTELNHANKTIKATLIRVRRGFDSFDISHRFDRALRLVKTSHVPERREIKMIDFDDLIRLVQAPDTDTLTGVRDSCFLSLMVGGALRITEALELKVGDVRHTPKGTLYVRLGMTKAGTPANQAISPRVARFVQEYASQRMIESDQSAPLLTAYAPNGKPLDKALIRRNASRSFYGYCERLGIKASPHSCRATAITKLLADGVHHREVQNFSRHSSVQMVEVYDKRRFGIDQSAAKDLTF